MRVLILSALYPPHVFGGAEDSAHQAAEWMQANGVDVGVLCIAGADEAEREDRSEGGVRIWRLRTPDIYPVTEFQKAPAWQKPLWHLQDHFDPRIRAKVGRVLDGFRPDVVVIHMLQGIGYPALHETASRRLPVVFVLHELALACIRGAMFRNGRECRSQCAGCRISSRYKQKLVAAQATVAFVSPSHAHLAKLAGFFPVADHPNAVILNPNFYPRPAVAREPQPAGLRLLYAGRLHAAKGIDMLLQAVAAVAMTHPVSIAVAGGGPEEAALRAQYGEAPWCRFLGHISQAELADVMVDSDLLCVPSIWAENSPGVAIQALGLGLPVMGSDRGGLPELIDDGVNGHLVAESTVEQWQRALERCIAEPTRVAAWRAGALAGAGRFDQDRLGRQLLDWLADPSGNALAR